jgi:dTMP kinase
VFVTFEGPDGAGKSTALMAVAENLRAQGIAVRTTRQPGDCAFGPDIRRLLLESTTVEAPAELFLYLADRTQNVAEVIRPALKGGCVVLCDRYTDSTLVYQGYARGLDVDLLRKLNDLATRGLRPDLTLLLDLPAEAGLARLRHKDRLDLEPDAFHRRVREGFLHEADREPDRWVLIDAEQPATQVAEGCLTAILGRRTA